MKENNIFDNMTKEEQLFFRLLDRLIVHMLYWTIITLIIYFMRP